jgi:hypothetical protein
VKVHVDTMCNICGFLGGTVTRIITKPDRFELYLGANPEKYARVWVLCNSCFSGYRFVPYYIESRAPLISTEYYNIDFQNTTLIEKYHRIMALTISDNESRVHRISEFISHQNNTVLRSDNPTLLDVGSGLGVFPSRFRQMTNMQGWKLILCEPDPLAYKHLVDLGFTSVIKSRIQEISNIDADFITMNKVLEHTLEPLKLLSSVSKLLKDRGFLYVEVPDSVSLNNCKDDDNSLGLIHYNIYSKLGLKRILEANHFEVLKVEEIHESSGKFTIYAFAQKRERLL